MFKLANERLLCQKKTALDWNYELRLLQIIVTEIRRPGWTGHILRMGKERVKIYEESTERRRNVRG
jgi:hypothetical protein